MSRFGYLLVLLALCSYSLAQSGSYNLTRHLSIQWEFFRSAGEGGIDSIRLTVQKTRKGWAAFGFGKSMLASEILLFERISSSATQMNVTNCYLDGYEAPKCDDMTQGWKIENNTASGSFMSVTATRSLLQKDLENGQSIFKKASAS